MRLFNENPLMNRFWKEGVFLQARWFDLFENFGVKFDYKSERAGETNLQFEFMQFFHAYSRENRFYHNVAHVVDCLREFDMVKNKSEHPLELEAALMAHDIVYDPQAKDNETKSADYIAGILFRNNVSAEPIGRVREIVMATSHSTPGKTIDEKFAADIDLAILGKPENVFREYDYHIRQEYSWVSEEQYREGRRKVLEGFLARTSIYQTDYFINRYEKQARKNLKEAIKKLK